MSSDGERAAAKYGMELTYEGLERTVVTWAEAQADIRAIVAVGSRARADHGADRWSDLDLVLFATDPSRYGNDKAWLGNFGEIWMAVPDRTGHGDAEWDVLYAGGLKADFVIAPAGDGEEALAQVLVSSPYSYVFGFGMRPLLDKNARDGGVSLPRFERVAPSKPDSATFEAGRARFLLDATRAARFIARSDLWRAKKLCDCVLKEQLLTMLEWHALATSGDGKATWYGGRFLGEWADAAALRDLPACFGTYRIPDLSRALPATLALYLRLAAETAGAWGYAPAERESGAVTAWILQTLGVNPRC